jgi:hypothetical protein
MSVPTPTTIDGLPTLTINALSAYSGSVDPVNDLIPIYENATTSTVGTSRNTYLNLSSAPVGLSDSQTLTNKTLTSPTISGPTFSGNLIGTYTIAGTPTFPSSVVQLASTQTLTNKTLTSPTINSPTISNATISADTVSGYTTSNSGTIYGISVATGVITTANSVSGGALTTNSIPSGILETNSVSAANLATSAITLGYAQITTTFSTTNTSATQVTGLTATVTIPAGGRKVKITVGTGTLYNATSTDQAILTIWDGTVGSGTQLQQANAYAPATNTGSPTTLIAVVTPAAGSKTYNVGLHATAGTANMQALSTGPAFILVEAI